MTHLLADDTVKAATRCWVEPVFVGLNLCPFAKREITKNRLRYSVTQVTSEELLRQALRAEIDLLDQQPQIETTLLIHPDVLTDFYDYNQFLDDADTLLAQLDRAGIYQIASFHPQYQYYGTAVTDVENYRNKSPYPMLHLIREESLATVIANYPNTEDIPETNIRRLKALGQRKMQSLRQSCLPKIKGL